MSANSNIEWTDHTFNPWMGCTKVSPACDHCYAERSTATRALGVTWGAGQPRRRTSPSNWALPIRWDAQHMAFAALHGRRQRVFCASLADVFDNEVATEWRDDLYSLIEATPNLDWLLLTKRVGNVKHMVWPKWMQAGFPANVWLGATIENQKRANEDIAKLLAVPARVHYLSMEPLLAPVSITPYLQHESWAADGSVRTRGILGGTRVDWVIVGGESGHQARPMHPDWARSLRDQCSDAGVPFLFKQWGEWAPTWFEAHRHLGPGMPADPAGSHSLAGTRLIVGEYSDGRKYEEVWPVVKVGKKAAGRLLDGVQHDGYPA